MKSEIGAFPAWKRDFGQKKLISNFWWDGDFSYLVWECVKSANLHRKIVMWTLYFSWSRSWYFDMEPYENHYMSIKRAVYIYIYIILGRALLLWFISVMSFCSLLLSDGNIFAAFQFFVKNYFLAVAYVHDDVIKWKYFPRYWPFVKEIHRSPVNFPHKGQWRGALMFTLICDRMNGWVNNHEAGDSRRYLAHCDVIVMQHMPTFAFSSQ